MCTRFCVDSSAVFFLERGQTDIQTDATERPTDVGGYTAGVGNKQGLRFECGHYYMHVYATFSAALLPTTPMTVHSTTYWLPKPQDRLVLHENGNKNQ